MPKKTIKVSTLKAMINREYTRDENLYNVYTNAGNGRNADYYAARLSTLIDIAAQIEQKTGATIFEDAEDFAAEIERETNSITAVEGEPCANTLSDSSPVQTSQNTPAKSISTASATL